MNFAYFCEVTGDPITLTLSTEAKETLVDIGATDVTTFAIGYVRQHGRGQVVYVGSNPSPELLRLVLKQIGPGVTAVADEKGVTACVHRHASDGSLALFVVNRGNASQSASISLNIKRLGIKTRKPYAVTDVRSKNTTAATGASLANLTVPVGAHDVAIRIIRAR